MRSTRPILILLVLVIGGLLLSGKGHVGVHDDHHGVECPACLLVGTAPPEPQPVPTPGVQVRVLVSLPPDSPEAWTPPGCDAPRGPPEAC